MQSGPSSDTAGSTSPSLLARARQQDGDAWQKLAALYAPVVYRWVRKAGVQPNDAADVGQEVFQVVATRLNAFRHELPGDSFRGWLWGITKNKLREHFRRQTGAQGAGGTAALEMLKQRAADLPGDSSQWDAPSARGELMRRALESIRGEFELSTWQAFWGVTIEEHQTAVIAADLGISTAAVRQAKYRVLRRLRQELDGLL